LHRKQWPTSESGPRRYARTASSRIDATNRVIHIDRPELPSEIERLAVRDLAIDAARVGLLFERVGERVTAAPLGPIGDSIQVLVRA
jgi:hypothetical protein